MKESWRRLALLAATGDGYLALRLYVLGGLGIPRNGQYLNGSVTVFQRWITSGRVFIQYFRLLLAPVTVTGDYDFNSVPIAGLRDWDARSEERRVGKSVDFGVGRIIQHNNSMR